MSQPAPAFTCVLTLIDDSLRILAVWIYVTTLTRFDLAFDLHLPLLH
jgi:hypothetical protein